MRKKVAFPSRHPFLLCDDAIQLLKDEGFELVFNETGKKLPPEEQKALISDAFAVISGTEKYDSDMLSGCDELKVIMRFGVGVDNFDLPTMKSMGIQVGVIANHNAVAEFTLALMLSVLKQLPKYDAAIRTGSWARFDMQELSGKTIGLIGFGRIGKRLSQLLSGFDVEVLAYSPHMKKDIEQEYKVSAVSLDELLSRSDIVSLHMPGNEENRHFINEETINKMKNGAILINTARGSLVDEHALYDALKSGKLGGVGLDVYETEPAEEGNPLFGLDKDVLSPHVSALTRETNYNAGMICAKSIINVSHGGSPMYPLW